ncbi:MAG: type VI secretion system baseplate subunit TssK [Phycisphaerae bacterium]
MSSWNEVHWHEGMFLRPHHLQQGHRWLKHTLQQDVQIACPYSWGIAELRYFDDALKNNVLQLQECTMRMKDGTWVRIPDNASVDPLNFEAALKETGEVELLFGIPRIDAVQANSIDIHAPNRVNGLPRYEPKIVQQRDENTGENAQQVYVRKIRGRLFTSARDATGYTTIRLGVVQRSDKVGAAPEFKPLQVGPCLRIQASRPLNAQIKLVIDHLDRKDAELAAEALELKMRFGDGVSANTEHLLKLHVLNGVVTRLRALTSGDSLHPFDAYHALAHAMGELSIFDETRLKADSVPTYDHDSPNHAIEPICRRIIALLDTLAPRDFARVDFTRSVDETGLEGLAVDLQPLWITAQYDMYVAFETREFDTQALYEHIYGSEGFDMKLASPKRSSRVRRQAVKGLRLRTKAVPAGTLPRRDDLHYFQIDRSVDGQGSRYWVECENERGIRMSLREDQVEAMLKLRPALYVILRNN